MFSLTLLWRESRANYKILLLFLAVLTLYVSMVTAMYDPKLGEALAAMMETMPEIFSLVGMQNPGTTLGEFLVNYLYGFLLVVLPLVFIVLMANRLMARYVDRGSMAYLLATPNKRRRIAMTQAWVMKVGVFVWFSTSPRFARC